MNVSDMHHVLSYDIDKCSRNAAATKPCYQPSADVWSRNPAQMLPVTPKFLHDGSPRMYNKILRARGTGVTCFPTDEPRFCQSRCGVPMFVSSSGMYHPSISGSRTAIVNARNSQ